MFWRRKSKRLKEEERELELHRAFSFFVSENIKRGERFLPETCRPFEVEDFIKIHNAKYVRPVEDKSKGLAVIFYKDETTK